MDLYSCFPVAVEIAAAELGLAPDGARTIVRSTDESITTGLLESDPLGAELAVSGPGALTIGRARRR